MKKQSTEQFERNIDAPMIHSRQRKITKKRKKRQKKVKKQLASPRN